LILLPRALIQEIVQSFASTLHSTTSTFAVGLLIILSAFAIYASGISGPVLASSTFQDASSSSSFATGIAVRSFQLGDACCALYDPANGFSYASLQNDGSYIVASIYDNKVVANISTGTGFPEGLAFNSNNGTVFGNNPYFEAHNGCTFNWLTTIQGSEAVNGYFDGLQGLTGPTVYDSANNYLYFAAGGTGADGNCPVGLYAANSSQISQSTFIRVGQQPCQFCASENVPALAFDGKSGKIFVPVVNNSKPDRTIVRVVKGFSVLGSHFDLKGATTSMIYDPANGYLYLEQFSPSNGSYDITVVNTSSNSVIGNVSLRNGPAPITLDTKNGTIYAFEQKRIVEIQGMTIVKQFAEPTGNLIVYSAVYDSGHDEFLSFVSFPRAHARFSLVSGNPQANGRFGSSVAMNSKFILVGAPAETVNGAQSAGSAYLFSATNGSLLRTFTRPNPQEDNDYFGSSVALGAGLAVIGAPYQSGNNGEAYLFNTTSGALIRTLGSPNPQGGLFALSVATSGGLVFVGAPEESPNGVQDAGNAYVFNATTGSLAYSLTSPALQKDGEFGDALASSGNLLLVGAPFENASYQYQAGRAYLFDARTGNLLQTFASPNAQHEGFFGRAVAVDGSFVAVGALTETSGGVGGAGNAYVFNSSSGALISELSNPHPQYYANFGTSVGVGSNGLVTVGAPYEGADGYTYAGQAYAFNSRNGSLIKTLTSPNVQGFGFFGVSAFMSGKLVVIGAVFENVDGYSSAGRAYVIDLPSSGPVLPLAACSP
jgi:hypothetical protein